MKPINSLMICLAFLYISSCKKNDSQPVSRANLVKKITTITPSDSTITEFYHDDNGRAKKIVSTSGITEYTYYNQYIKVKNTSTSGNVSESRFNLNERGLLISVSGESSSTSYNIGDDGFVKIEILTGFTNGAPNFLQTKYYFYNSSTSLLDSVVLFVGNSRTVTIYTAYTNYPDNRNKTRGQNFIPPNLKYMPAETKNRFGNSLLTSTVTYNYVFDARGRLQTTTTTSVSGTTRQMYEYWE